MRIRRLEYIDWNSPGTLDPERGERPREEPLDEVEAPDDLTPELVQLVQRTEYRPSAAKLLPADRFPDTRAEAWHGAMIHAPTGPEETGSRSVTVDVRLRRSCAGWVRRPTAREFYEAVRSRQPTERQRSILDTWANEAEPHELLAAWTEHAYTFRELAAALHRAGLSRCRAADTLNRWAIHPRRSVAEPPRRAESGEAPA